MLQLPHHLGRPHQYNPRRQRGSLTTRKHIGSRKRTPSARCRPQQRRQLLGMPSLRQMRSTRLRFTVHPALRSSAVTRR